MLYPYKVWGFGEEIALHALLEYGDVAGVPEPGRFVENLVGGWCRTGSPLTPADHVAPGSVTLALHERTGDPAYLAAAERLGDLYRSFEEVDGVPVHRRDHEQLGHLIWVDCLAIDGPFLVRLARATGDDAWLRLALHTIDSYVGALADPNTSLLRHGYDVEADRRSPCSWGRGNGWAMHGLVDTLEALPPAHPAREELAETLRHLVDAILPLQAVDGRWHTILDDPESPLENSTAALFASALLKARRLDALPDVDPRRLAFTLDRAVAALAHAMPLDGGLVVSYATPVGERSTYVNAPLGTFPWGLGPLILTYTELARVRPGPGQAQDVHRPGGSPS